MNGTNHQSGHLSGLEKVVLTLKLRDGTRLAAPTPRSAFH